MMAVPFLAAFIVSIIFAPATIGMLQRRKVGQTISTDGPESHLSKAGTPTMGGLIIVAGILGGTLVASLIMTSKSLSGGMFTGKSAVLAFDLLSVIVLMAAYSLLGMLDDYLTVHPVNGVRGISSKPKAAIQILLAIAFVWWIGGHRPEPFSPYLFLFGKPIISGVLYWIFSVVFIVGMANFVNITDGLDGLVSGLTAITAMAFVCTLALVPPHVGFDSSLMVILMAVAGACVAFLWFNTNPARVFMGDTGSLALGVVLPAIAILTHREALMIIIGMVFVMDGVSTMIQWAVFKYTRITTGTGRRVFKKSPIHHHFEMSGWPENAVVVRFWIMGIIAAVVAFAGAAWRLW